MTAIASSSPSASTRRSAIQSGIECRSAAVSAPPESSSASRLPASVARRRMTALTTPARADDRTFGPRRARAWRTAWSTAAWAGTPSEKAIS